MFIVMGGNVCVVEDAIDVLAVERAGAFQGKYHVLQGAISPIQGIGPDDLRIHELEERVKAGGIKEVIIATNPSMEGDATALYFKTISSDRSILPVWRVVCPWVEI